MLFAKEYQEGPFACGSCGRPMVFRTSFFGAWYVHADDRRYHCNGRWYGPHTATSDFRVGTTPPKNVPGRKTRDRIEELAKKGYGIHLIEITLRGEGDEIPAEAIRWALENIAVRSRRAGVARDHRN